MKMAPPHQMNSWMIRDPGPSSSRSRAIIHDFYETLLEGYWTLSGFSNEPLWVQDFNINDALVD